MLGQKWDNSFWQVKEGRAREPLCVYMMYVYSQSDVSTVPLLLRSGNRQMLPEDCVATVGWMQQHQRGKRAHTQSVY